jgi:hypothetical protein
MRILIQHTETGLYLSKGGKWAKSPLEALAFLDEVRARDHCVYRRLTKVSVIVFPERHAPDPAAMRGTEAQLDQHIIEIGNMKPKQSPTTKDTKKTAVAAERGKPSIKAAAQAAVVSPSSQRSAKPEREAQATSSEKRVSRSRQAVKTPGNPEPGSAQPLAGAVAVKSPAQAAEVTAVQPSSEQEVITAVEAKIDVGFGNLLYIRGQGDGLNWDEGKPLQCVAPNIWVWSTTRATGKVVFKLLINDQVWSQGEDWTVRAGEKAKVVPAF